PSAHGADGSDGAPQVPTQYIERLHVVPLLNGSNRSHLPPYRRYHLRDRHRLTVADARLRLPPRVRDGFPSWQVGAAAASAAGAGRRAEPDHKDLRVADVARERGPHQ